MTDPERKPRIQRRSRRCLWGTESRRLRRLDAKFQTIMAQIEANPTKVVMETRRILIYNLVFFLRNEGLQIPKAKKLFELWGVARPAFGDRRRFDPDILVIYRLMDTLMLIEEVVVSELEHLPNHGFRYFWCERPKSFRTDEARLIALLGYLATAFIISIGGDNADARLMGHEVPIMRNLPHSQTKPVASAIACPSLWQRLTGIFKAPLTAIGRGISGRSTKPDKKSSNPPAPAGGPATGMESEREIDPKDILF